MCYLIVSFSDAHLLLYFDICFWLYLRNLCASRVSISKIFDRNAHAAYNRLTAVTLSCHLTCALKLSQAGLNNHPYLANAQHSSVVG
jgi:hypothetical protein